MAIQFDCPSCGAQVTARYMSPGETMQCPHCKNQIQAPRTGYTTVEDAARPHVKQSPEEGPSAPELGFGPILAGMGWLSILVGVGEALYVISKTKDSYVGDASTVLSVLVGLIFVMLGVVAIGVASVLGRVGRLEGSRL